MSLILLGLQLFLIFSSFYHKNVWLGIVFFFMLSYCYEPSRYYFFHEQIATYSQSQTPSTVYYTGLLTLIFNLVFSWVIPFQNNCKNIGKPIQIRSNILIYLFCLVFGIVCLVQGKSGQTIIESGGYGNTLRNMEGSSLFGYGVIPLAVCLIYADSKVKRIILYCVCLIYIMKDFLLGGRVDSIILCLSLYMLRFRYIWSTRTTLIILAFGLVLNLTWGSFRSNTSVNFYDTLSTEINNIGFRTGNSGEVYYASMRIYYMIEQGVLTTGKRIQSALEFLLSSVMPYNKLSSLANLSSYNRWHFRTLGGGLISVFLYAWGGVAGVIGVACLIGYAIRRFITAHVSKYFNLYICLVIATCPRWYAYYPIQLIKFCVFGVLFFVLMETVRTGKLPSFRKKMSHAK